MTNNLILAISFGFKLNSNLIKIFTIFSLTFPVSLLSINLSIKGERTLTAPALYGEFT